MTAKLVKKISPRTVCPELLKRLDQPGAPKEIVLYDIYGLTNTTRTGTTDKGDWLQFKGQFEAIVDSSGEVFNSGAVFLPQPFQDMLYGELSKAKEGDPNASVQFACRVSIVPPTPGKVSATGYEYMCMPLIDAAEESPLAHMRKLIGEKRRLLLSASNPDNGAKPVSGKKPSANA